MKYVKSLAVKKDRYRKKKKKNHGLSSKKPGFLISA